MHSVCIVCLKKEGLWRLTSTSLNPLSVREMFHPTGKKITSSSLDPISVTGMVFPTDER
jgi:hypothetical protein